MTISSATSIANSIPGMGSPTNGAVQVIGTVLGSGAAVLTIPAAGVLTFNGAAYTLSKGWVRVRIYTVTGTTPTYAINTVQGLDGTNTVTFGSTATSATLTATSELDFIFIFNSERAFSTFKITTTGAGTTPAGLMDVEIAGNP